MKKKAQVLIEEVLYILIALALIGMVLVFSYPKIQETQDKATLEESLEMMQNIADTIKEVNQGADGNQRIMELKIKKGEILINAINDSLVFELESSYLYSEPGRQYSRGDLVILTTQKGKSSIVTFSLKYKDIFNITYAGKEETKNIEKASLPYKIVIKKNGRDANDTPIIDVEVL